MGTYKLLLHLQVFSDPRIRSYRNHKNSKEHKTAKIKEAFKYDNTCEIIMSEPFKFLPCARQAEF